MSEGAALHAAILADPEDDTVRLAYADWLDERAGAKGEPTPCPRAAYIRAKIIGGVPNRGLGPWPSWAGVLRKIGDGRSRTWSRGFVAGARCPLAAWLAHGPAVVRAHPVQVVRLTDRAPLRIASVGFGWYDEEHHYLVGQASPDLLPQAIFRLLPREGRNTIADADLDYWGWYDAEQTARAALSAAALAWARSAPNSSNS